MSEVKLSIPLRMKPEGMFVNVLVPRNLSIPLRMKPEGMFVNVLVPRNLSIPLRMKLVYVYADSEEEANFQFL